MMTGDSRSLALAGAVVLLNTLLLLPLLGRFGLPLFTWFAVEALLVPVLFALLPRWRSTGCLAWVTALVLVAAVVVGLADAAVWRALYRPLNLYLDGSLAAFADDLLVTNLGWWTARALEAAGVAVAVLIWVVLAKLLGAARGALRGPVAAASGLAVLLVATAALGSRAVLTSLPSFHAPVADLVMEQVQRGLASRREAARFADELAGRAARSGPSALPGLAGVDVVLAFVESYGASALDDPRHARVVSPAVTELARAVERAGLHMVSGRLAAPVQGGQSWLAHGSVLSGLWLDSQLRYDLMLRENAATLIDDFRATGHRTVGVFPAITGPWPVGRQLGYDAVHDAHTMDYRGPSLNWVTMPDQFTWSWLQREVLAPEPAPVFAELALISSHAPWTPILPVLEDWESIGDGRVFGPWADAGPSPSAVWRDTERVRRHFAGALRYALGVVSGYVTRHVDDRTLLIVLGDHQPAPLITGEDASAAVPVHVISGDPALLAPFRANGFRAGNAGARASGPVARQSALRGWLHAGFGAPERRITPAGVSAARGSR